MLRTNFQGKELIVRIKQIPLPNGLGEEQVYKALLANINTIYPMKQFAVLFEGYMIVGETQQSAIPLMTIQSIVPLENIIGL